MLGELEQMPASPQIDASKLPERLDALPGIDLLREATAEQGVPAYLVGGAVRDLLLGRPRADLDVAVEGAVAPLAEALGGEMLEHDRFETAAVTTDGHEIDIARAREETYERPGALPEVKPAGITQDLARRDFTLNAMAVPLTGEPALLDPHDGAKDLAAGVLRVLHDLSFQDDPTRALRAARYAARLGLMVEPGTERLLRLADLSTVSDDRVVGELARISAEERPSAALKLIEHWGVMDLGTGARLAAALEKLFEGDGESSHQWREYANRDTAILLAVAPGEHPDRLRQRAAKLAHHATPGSPAEIQVLAKDHVPEVLAMARAAGAAWLDDYVGRLRYVVLEITGYDLVESGVPQGPAIGRGLNAALAAKLDGTVSNADEELDVALDAAEDASAG
jgi:tRNA nucleotidyltransferase (CCA-adding enzyme)